MSNLEYIGKKGLDSFVFNLWCKRGIDVDNAVHLAWRPYPPKRESTFSLPDPFTPASDNLIDKEINELEHALWWDIFVLGKTLSPHHPEDNDPEFCERLDKLNALRKQREETEQC